MKVPHRRKYEADRLQLGIPVLLPNLPDEADACIGRLVGELQGRDGIDRVHLLPASGVRRSARETSDFIVIDYDYASQYLARCEAVRAWGGQETSLTPPEKPARNPAPEPASSRLLGL